MSNPNEADQYLGEIIITESKIRGVVQKHNVPLKILPRKVKLNFLRYTLMIDGQNNFCYPEKEAPTTYSPKGAPTVKGYNYVSTTLRPGYVYIIFENKPDLFKEFQVQEGGLLRNIESDLSEDIRTPKSIEHSQYYFIEKDDTVWISYSEFQWTADYIQKIRSDANMRDKRMQKFVATDWVNNSYPENCFDHKNIESCFPLEPNDTKPEKFPNGAWSGGQIADFDTYYNIQQWMPNMNSIDANDNENDDWKRNAFICLDDPMGCADELLTDLNQKWAEMEALVITIQTGIDRHVVLNEIIRKGKKPEEIIDGELLKQREHMHKSLLLLYQTGYCSPENEKKFGKKMDRGRMELLLGKQDRQTKRDEIKTAKELLVTFLKNNYYQVILDEAKEFTGITSLHAKLRYAAHISQLQYRVNAKDYLFDLEEVHKKNLKQTDKGIDYLKEELDSKRGLLFEEVEVDLSVSLSYINSVILTWNTIKSGLDKLVKDYPVYLTTKVESLNSIRIIRNGQVVADKCFDVITLEKAIKNKPFLKDGKQMLNLTDELIEKANTYATRSGLETIEQVIINQNFEKSFHRNGKLYDLSQTLEDSKLWNRFVVGVAAFNLGLAVNRALNEKESISNADKFKNRITIIGSMAAVIETGRSYQILQQQVSGRISKELADKLKLFPARMSAVGVWANAANDAIDSGINVYRADYDAAAAQGAAAVCGAIAGIGLWFSWNPAGWIALLVAGVGFTLLAVLLEDDPLEEMAKCCEFRDSRRISASGTIEKAIAVHTTNSYKMVKKGFKDWGDYELLYTRLSDILFGGAITLRSKPNVVGSRGVGPSVVKEYFKQELYLHVHFNMARMSLVNPDCQVYLFPYGFAAGKERIQLTEGPKNGNLRVLSQDDPTAEHFIAFFDIPEKHRHIPNKQWRMQAEVVVICRCVDNAHTFPIDKKGTIRYVAIREKLYEEATTTTARSNVFTKGLHEKMEREAKEKQEKEVLTIRASGDSVMRGTKNELLSPGYWEKD